MNTNAAKTEHENLYSKTYWGSFQKDDEYGAQEIIQNRNAFVGQFSILDFHSSPCLSRFRFDDLIPHDFTDHLEVYRTKTKAIVIIVSPYQEEGCMIPTSAVRLGFTPYKKMYDLTASTFIAVFPDLKTFKKEFRMATIKSHK